MSQYGRNQVRRFTTLNSAFHTVVFSLPFLIQYEGKSNSWRCVWVTHLNTLLTINIYIYIYIKCLNYSVFNDSIDRDYTYWAHHKLHSNAL